MTHINFSDGFGILTALTLIASVFVLLYLFNYAITLYYQAISNRIRSDWKISALFYIGVALIAFGNIFSAMHICFGDFCLEKLFDPFLLLALLLFTYGFRKRSVTSEKVEEELRRFHEHMKSHGKPARAKKPK